MKSLISSRYGLPVMSVIVALIVVGIFLLNGYTDDQDDTTFDNAKEFVGTVFSGAQLDEKKEYCSEGMYLVADEGTLLPNQAATIQLRVLIEETPELFNEPEYVGKRVQIAGLYEEDRVSCEALICECDDYITVNTIQVL